MSHRTPRTIVLGQRLLAARERAGISAPRAAVAIGMSAQDGDVIRNWESGALVPSALDVCDLAEAYGCAPGDLLPDLEG